MQTSRYVSSPSKKCIQKEKNDDQVLSSVNLSKKISVVLIYSLRSKCNNFQKKKNNFPETNSRKYNVYDGCSGKSNSD